MHLTWLPMGEGSPSFTARRGQGAELLCQCPSLGESLNSLCPSQLLCALLTSPPSGGQIYRLLTENIQSILDLEHGWQSKHLHSAHRNKDMLECWLNATWRYLTANITFHALSKFSFFLQHSVIFLILQIVTKTNYAALYFSIIFKKCLEEFVIPELQCSSGSKRYYYTTVFKKKMLCALGLTKDDLHF